MSFDTGFGKLLPTCAGLRASATQATAKKLRYVIVRMVIKVICVELEREKNCRCTRVRKFPSLYPTL